MRSKIGLRKKWQSIALQKTLKSPVCSGFKGQYKHLSYLFAVNGYAGSVYCNGKITVIRIIQVK